jgi:hypothetical protein
MLRLAVPVRMAGVGGTPGDADGVERQQRRHEVGPRVRRFREEAEAVGGDAGDQLDANQHACGDDRDERCAALRAHAPKDRTHTRT